MIKADPAASIRTIAKAAGVSPSTVWDVQERLRNGVNPVPQRQEQAETAGKREERRDRLSRRPMSRSREKPADAVLVLRNLRNDPSLRLKEAGRELLRWLETHAAAANDYQRLADTVPAHCTTTIAELARTNARVWSEFANQVERRGREIDQNDS
jgi:hypothetical protein